jgi:hypothetical protein
MQTKKIEYSKNSPLRPLRLFFWRHLDISLASRCKVYEMTIGARQGFPEKWLRSG